MPEELLINVTPQETRVATVENGMLTEVWVERKQKIGLVGSIYKGVVIRVLPGMEAAFIDIGLERSAFLHVSDIAGGQQINEHGERSHANITKLVQEGTQLVVQVIKDPLGTKGARVTSNLTAPSRFLVLMPHENNIGISARIESEDERERLKNIVTELRADESCGYIVRTAAEGAESSALKQDIVFLNQVWKSICEKCESSRVGDIIYKDLPLVLRTMRDIKGETVERIRVDSRETFQMCEEFCAEYVPHLCGCIEHYPGERPIFDLHGVEDEIDRALGKKVLLKSGGAPDY